MVECFYTLQWVVTSPAPKLEALLLQRDRAMCYISKFVLFLEVWDLERFQTAKVIFKVIQGHCHLIGHMQFPISFEFPLQLSLFCTVNEILSLVSQNLRRSHDTSLILFGGSVSW